MKLQDIEAKIDKLPAHVIPEVNDFIDYLLVKYGEKKLRKANLSLIGKAVYQI